MPIKVLVVGENGLRDAVDRKPSYFDIRAASDIAVGGRIRAYRKMAGLSQRELAQLATEVLTASGNPSLADERVTQSDITRLERDPSRARVFLVSAVCEVLQKRVHDVIECDTTTLESTESHVDSDEKIKAFAYDETDLLGDLENK